MATILEVINGISQAIHAKHEGGAAFGLKRESEPLLQGVSIYDPRIIDGFGVQFQGDMLLLKYHSEMPLSSVHEKDFQVEIERNIRDICEHIKIEYKKIKKQSLSLTSIGDLKVMLQTANRRTVYVNAVQTYKINNVEIDKGTGVEVKNYDDSQENFTNIAKRWLMNVKE